MMKTHFLVFQNLRKQINSFYQFVFVYLSSMLLGLIGLDLKTMEKKLCVWEAMNLSTCADSSTNIKTETNKKK